MNKTFKYLIGIDEVGRGPLAGPVAVCASIVEFNALRNDTVSIKERFLNDKLPSLRDSKKLTEKGREAWFAHLVKDGTVTFCLSYASAQDIDKKGIVVCIKELLENNLDNLQKEMNFNHDEVIVLLDGGLKAPEKYLHQETIVGGDDKEPIIAFASIYAKVSRDNLMKGLAVTFPEYGFEKHKGYGTATHIDAIRKHNPTIQHRKSFLGNIKH